MNEKAQAPGRTNGMPSHLHLAHCGPGLIGVQTGARIVRQTQEQAGPEYIRPGAASSRQAVTPAASKSATMSAGVNLIWGLKYNPQGARRRGNQNDNIDARRSDRLGRRRHPGASAE